MEEASINRTSVVHLDANPDCGLGTSMVIGNNVVEATLRFSQAKQDESGIVVFDKRARGSVAIPVDRIIAIEER